MSPATKTTRQIAIAIDPLSEEANATIDWTMENFLRSSDEIHVMMVMVLDTEFGELGSPGLPPTDYFDQIKKQETLKKTTALEVLVDKMTKTGFLVKTHIFKTDSTHACDVLIEYLEKQDMDCLVMGSRNLSGWKRFFMGSFSDYVQSHVHCPVLIVK